jgi:uncharacterized NAD-dependent epimerase/dehydratase family protein
MSEKTALLLAEKTLNHFQAKTAHGLLRKSVKYDILGVIDSNNAGEDAGEIVFGKRNDIQVYSGLTDALTSLSDTPSTLIVGVATIGGLLPQTFRPIISEALTHSMDIVSGLHEFLGDDSEFQSLAEENGASIFDIRKWRPIKELHEYLDLVKVIPALRIPVFGTDSSIGKRTIAWFVSEALNEAQIPTVFVATGQTGLIQGAEYGVPLDAIRGDYMVGELENQIYKAYRDKHPEVIVIEGQGSISHPAYISGTRAVISASKPSGIILQHAPMRKFRHYGLGQLNIPMPDIKKEIEMLEMFSESKVIGLTINHEDMLESEIENTIHEYEDKYRIPTCDALRDGCNKLIDTINKMIP